MSESDLRQNTFDFTVAIPTYNGAQRLPVVLERLAAQLHTEGIRWEILIIDNNSQDDTAAVVQQYADAWRSHRSIRYGFEPRQGAAFARQHAIRAAQSELIGFLDDDNLPDPHWVATAVRFSQQYPQAGAFSGRIYGAYQTEPPEGFAQIQAFLAIRDHGDQVMPFAAAELRLPPAASLVVRQTAWLNSVPAEPKLTGKLPGLFIQGDDYEPLIYMAHHQWEILYTPDLITYHQIPPQRFEKAYLLTLAKGCGLATYHLKSIQASRPAAVKLAIRIMGGNLRRLVTHFWRYRQRVFQELEPAFLWSFYWGSFLSPLVKLKHR